MRIVLLLLIAPIGFIYGLFRGSLRRYLYLIGRSIDQIINVTLCELTNDLFIQSWSKNPFGNPQETISGVLGKNQLDGTLKPLGRYLVSLFSKNSIIKSIERDEKYKSN